MRRVEIPKSSGGVRNLGIPTIVDRIIQEAVVQVLTPIVEPYFSEYSYGFIPGRKAQQAVMNSGKTKRGGKHDHIKIQ